MAFVDLLADYDYKPTFTPITPDSAQQQNLLNTAVAGPTVLDPNKYAGSDPVGNDVIDQRGAVAQNSGGGGPTWNSTYQMWEQDGRFWDPDTGIWLTPGETPDQTMAYREGVGDQSIAQYNDYNKVLQELYGGADGGGFAGNPVVAEPSIFKTQPLSLGNADWTNVDAAMDRPSSVTPSAGWYNVDAALDPNKGTFPTQAQPYNYNLNGPDISKFSNMDMGDQSFLNDLRVTDPQQAGYKADVRFPTGGGMLGMPLSSQFKTVYDAYVKNIQNPVAETGAQLTPIGFAALKGMPGGAAVFGGIEAATGWSPEDNIAPGVKELGSAVKSGDFIGEQNKNLAERPGWQQLAATTAFDPANLLGAGLGANALKSGALEGGGLLSKILSGAAKFDKGIDTAQAAAVGLLGPVAKGAGKSLKPLIGETGAVSTNLAFRGGLAAAAGGAGYLTADEDASNQEKFLRALAFGGAVAAGPEVIGKVADVGAKTYGKIPGLAERGAGHMRWLEDAPVSDALNGTAVDPILRLKDITSAPLPLRTKISNTFWSALAVVDKEKFATHIDDARVRGIAVMTEENARKIPRVAEVWSNEYTPDFALFPADDNGAILMNGQYLPVLDKDGLPVGGVPTGAGTSADKTLSKSVRASLYEREEFITAKQKSLDFLNRKVANNDTGIPQADLLVARDDALRELENLQADYASFQSRVGVKPQTPLTSVENAGMADLMRSKEWYLENGFIDQAQYDALNRIQSGLTQFQELQAAFKLTPDPDLRIDPANGAYYPFGRPTDQLAEATPRKPTPGRKIGVEPGSSKTRYYDSIGQGINDGKKYPKPADAAKQYISEVLAQVNAENATRNLEKVGFEAELKGGKQYVTLGQLRPDPALKDEWKEQVKAYRELKAEKKKLVTRKTRIDRDIRLGTRWVDTNRKRIETLNNTLADKALSADARANVAKEMLDLTRVSIKDAESAAREYLKATAKTAVKDSEARKALRKVLDEADRVSKGMDSLEDQITTADLAEMAMSGKFVDAWGYSDSIRAAVAQDAAGLERVMADLAGRYGDSLETSIGAREALEKVERQFRDELTHMRQLNREASDEATKNAVAAEQVRQALSGDKTKELDRVVEQRAEQVKAAFGKSEELRTEIDRLKQMMAPVGAARNQLKADIKITRDLAKETSQQFKGKIAGTGWGLAGWENTPVPAQIANSWRKVVTDTNSTSRLGDLYDFVNNTFRMLGATADISRTATVGALGFADNTSASMKGFKVGVDVVRKGPEAAAQALRDIEAAARADGINVPLTTAVGHDLQMSTAEQFHRGYADENTLADKFTKLPVIKQADIMYSVPANVERATRFYDTLRAWKIAGKDYTSDRAISMAANAANTITGRANRGFGDMLIGDRGASRMFFAARFVQSQIETVMNALLVGGVEGEEARRALLKLAIGGTAITYGVNELSGNSTDWQPIKDGNLNSNFMRMRIGDQDISVFGPWDSLMKGLLSVYQRDPDYFIRSKLGPIPGMIADTAYRANAIGQPVHLNPLEKETYSPENILRRAPIPFGVRATIEAGRDTDFTDPKSIGNFALSAAASLTGVKTTPMTNREQYERMLADPYDKWESQTAYPHPKNPMDDPLFLADFASKHPNDVPGPSSQVGKDMKEIRDPIRKDIETNTTRFIEGSKTLGEWKDARKELKAKERTALEHITKEFNGIDPPKDTPAYYLNEYFKTFADATVDGLLDYDKLDKLQGEMLASSPPWVADYVDEYFLAKAAPGPEREYRAALNQLNKDGYFSGEANSIPRYQNLISGISDKEIDDYRKIIDDWGKRPEYEFLKGKPTETKAVAIIGDYWDSIGKEYDPLVIKDIGNSAKSAYENIDFKMYKLDHPELLAWLNPDLSWETLQAITQK